MYQTLIDNNLNIFFGGQYKDMPVQIHTEWLIEEYLEATYRTIFNALAEYPSTCIVRVDLKLPKHYKSNSDNVILNFISSLQGQIDADLKHRATVGEPVQSCKIRYVAARDRNKFLTDQYHLLLFFNLKTYNCIGKREVNIGGNMGEMLRIAWSEALAYDLDYVKQANLVSVPKDPVYHIHLVKGNSQPYWSDIKEIFYRFSHFTTTVGKNFSQGYSPFIHSRD